jgi:hypothetical protein
VTSCRAQLNHTIVWCRDKQRSSAFLVRILGCSPAVPFYHFMVVQLANNVSLDFMEESGPISVQHLSRDDKTAHYLYCSWQRDPVDARAVCGIDAGAACGANVTYGSHASSRQLTIANKTRKGGVSIMRRPKSP